MATNKTPLTVIDAYIANSPKDVQAILEKVRVTIRKAAPKAEEIINYGIPTFTLGVIWSILRVSRIILGFIPHPAELKDSKLNCPSMRAQRAR